MMALFRYICLTMALVASASVAQAERVSIIHIDGAIGPATADYIARAIRVASADGSQCLIIRLDTPGGLVASTQEIVQDMLGSTLPVVVYVSPSGGGAISAGCFITLAGHIAAMAPATNIGAAHPVAIGGGAGGGGGQEQDPNVGKKAANFAISLIEAIAKERNRNVEWAAASVRDSEAITAEKALELNVIDLIASDLNDLLMQIDGREIDGRTLRTAGADVAEIKMNLGERFFQTIWHPEVLMILMLIAIYGIMGELSNPGAVIPGVAGGIALILMLYMVSVLPVEPAGLALIALAIVLFVAEAFTPTFGLLTAGGVVSFLLGSLMLFDRAEPYYRLSLAMVIPATALTAGFFVFVVSAGLKAQRRPVLAGAETLLGMMTEALTPIDARTGKVIVEGEMWNAVSDTPIAAGDKVRIVARDGLTLKVEPQES